MEITSLKNDHVKYWNNLKNKKFRDQERKFIIEGDHLISEAKKLGLKMEIISIENTNADYFVTQGIMQKISDQMSISSNIAVVDFLEEKELDGNVIILDGIQDPGNLGTIIRSCVAFNIPNIILGDNSVDLYNPKVIRATEGMLFHTNVIRKDLNSFLSTLKNMGYTIVGTDLKATNDLKDIPKKNVAIVVGNEGNGISKNVKDMCDQLVKIDINSNCESLNAAVAASILMYEINK